MTLSSIFASPILTLTFLCKPSILPLSPPYFSSSIPLSSSINHLSSFFKPFSPLYFPFFLPIQYSSLYPPSILSLSSLYPPSILTLSSLYPPSILPLSFLYPPLILPLSPSILSLSSLYPPYIPVYPPYNLPL